METRQVGLTSRGLVVGSLLLIVLISIGHYATDVHNIAIHNLYRRLYYLPVVLAAFAQGLKGGLKAALLSSLAYAPHAFFMRQHHDPAPAVDKVFEIILYFMVGALTGWLVEREHDSRRKLQCSLHERDTLERELVRAGKLSALGELLAGVAHEIRNPLASIMGAAEGLARGLEQDDKKHRLVELQLREIMRLNRVVSNFLAFARTNPPAHANIKLDQLITQITDLARHQGQEGQFVQEDSLVGATTVADRDQIMQILLNLTLNAIQAVHPNTSFLITYAFEVRVIAHTPHDCIRVTDAGVGIDKAHLEQIFNPYFTTRELGIGLGLSISSRLAEAHGGFLEVISDAQETTFWLCLPQNNNKIKQFEQKNTHYNHQ